MDGTSSDIARDTYRWAVEHGKRYRIAYACHENDFPVPDNWTADTLSLAGIKAERRKHRRDMVMFSPACLDRPQQDLFN